MGSTYPRAIRTQAGISMGLGRRTGKEDGLQQTQPLSCRSRRDLLSLEGSLGTSGEQEEIHDPMELIFRELGGGAGGWELTINE